MMKGGTRLPGGITQSGSGRDDAVTVSGRAEGGPEKSHKWGDPPVEEGNSNVDGLGTKKTTLSGGGTNGELGTGGGTQLTKGEKSTKKGDGKPKKKAVCERRTFLG